MDLTQFERELNEKVGQFRKKAEAVRNDENPINTAEVKEYQTRKLREELESEVQRINEAYKKAVKKELELAKEAAAKSYFYVSELDKPLVNHKLNEFISNVELAYTDEDRELAIEKLEEQLKYMNAPQLYYTKTQLPRVLQSITNESTKKSLRRINHTLSALKTSEQERYDEVIAMSKRTPDYKFRTMKLTHPAYSDYVDNRYHK